MTSTPPPLPADLPVTLTAQVMDEVRRRIASRQLTSGTRLPSIRALADALKVSKSTVVEAYDRLAAEGAILARRGSGFYVAQPAAPLSLEAVGPRLDREVDPLWVSRQALESADGLLKPGCGWLPADWLPHESLRRALRSLARAEPAELGDYEAPQGMLPLRQLLARRLAEQNIDAGPEQILLMDSGTQALDLLCRFLLEPGDCVLVDDPCYFNFHALLRAHRAKVVAVPYTPGGPDLARFEHALETHRPRLYLTNSALHNPTGATLSPVVAHRVLKLAEQYALTIVEDNIFADFEPEPSPRLAAFDGLERVVHVGSFSKTLSAATRCGYLAVRRDWHEPLLDLKVATSFGSSRLSAGLVHRMLKDGSYRRHVEGLRQRLARTLPPVAARLKEQGITPWAMPRAGIFLWCHLPDGVDAVSLAREALTHEVVLAPGNVFSLSGNASGFMRFNIAQSTDPRLYEVLRRLLG
ncbi:aminotransferase-like domain-containing protein [Pseudomonas mangiferae]|uniref:PLP-dependent aminotransferase family protein n=1 Tax=Pseudomonas mangiferae TaxID=2593654 RepID=A0A553H515_9PSED|nr:PLP-dependent aminotransferase family protein [Pseudomonas mangiferae]TRX76794.1 PLP-dependent aminotransferase family protein [Pseudomonas mangiferae]